MTQPNISIVHQHSIEPSILLPCMKAQNESIKKSSCDSSPLTSSISSTTNYWLSPTDKTDLNSFENTSGSHLLEILKSVLRPKIRLLRNFSNQTKKDISLKGMYWKPSKMKWVAEWDSLSKGVRVWRTFSASRFGNSLAKQYAAKVRIEAELRGDTTDNPHPLVEENKIPEESIKLLLQFNLNDINQEDLVDQLFKIQTSTKRSSTPVKSHFNFLEQNDSRSPPYTRQTTLDTSEVQLCAGKNVNDNFMTKEPFKVPDLPLSNKPKSHNNNYKTFYSHSSNSNQSSFASHTLKSNKSNLASNIMDEFSYSEANILKQPKRNIKDLELNSNENFITERLLEQEQKRKRYLSNNQIFTAPLSLSPDLFKKDQNSTDFFNEYDSLKYHVPKNESHNINPSFNTISNDIHTPDYILSICKAASFNTDLKNSSDNSLKSMTYGDTPTKNMLASRNENSNYQKNYLFQDSNNANMMENFICSSPCQLFKSLLPEHSIEFNSKCTYEPAGITILASMASFLASTLYNYTTELPFFIIAIKLLLWKGILPNHNEYVKFVIQQTKFVRLLSQPLNQA